MWIRRASCSARKKKAGTTDAGFFDFDATLLDAYATSDAIDGTAAVRNAY
jgi:hypothetical protein